jgi:acetylornithine/succinyldiaminopimelate/putrescine aminotransferase
VKPDIVTLAKGMCGGVPAGAVLAGEKTADTLGISDHGSTFGDNTFAAAGLVVLETVSNSLFLKEIARKGVLLQDTLRSWKHPKITDIRDRGLMIGVDITTEAWPVVEQCLERGLLVLEVIDKVC